MKDTVDDPVVYEADVHFAPKRKGDLYLFQFSHNASPFSAKRKRLGPIRAKPKSSQFEIELLMDQQSHTFDRDKSKEIAYSADDDRKEEQERFFPNQMMTKQLLNSERLTSTGFPFALAYLRSDLPGLKLIPVKSVLDFKPAFRYLDRAKINANKRPTDEDSDEDDEPDEPAKPEPATKKITMRFENRRSNEAKPEVNPAANQENEDWMNVQYFDYGISKFEREKSVLLYKTEKADISEEDTAPAIDQKVKKFSYEEFARDPDQVPDFQAKELRIDLLNTMPFHQTASLALRDQVRSILVSSKVISFHKCVQLLSLNLKKNRLASSSMALNGKLNGQLNGQLNDTSKGQLNEQSNNQLDMDLVLRYLEQYAQLVQGNWVVKSEAIYPKRPKNAGRPSILDLNSIPFTDISVDMLKSARDYVLYKFTKEDSLSRLELIEQVRVPPAVIGEILAQLSTFNPATRSWDFVYPRDEAFIEQHKELVARQDALWEETSNQLMELFS